MIDSPNSQHSTESLEDSNDPGKMFVGGLSWQTTPEKMKEYFSQFGEVADATVMKDQITKRSRGFGFIKFADPQSVDRVLSRASHTIDEKKVDPKVAVPRRNKTSSPAKTKKVFVGGLSADTKPEDLQLYFGTFGEVEEVHLMFDKQTQRHRGFGFVLFADPDVVDKVVEIHFHEINDKVVECKKAQPKEVMAAQTKPLDVNSALLWPHLANMSNPHTNPQLLYEYALLQNQLNAFPTTNPSLISASSLAYGVQATSPNHAALSPYLNQMNPVLSTHQSLTSPRIIDTNPTLMGGYQPSLYQQAAALNQPTSPAPLDLYNQSLISAGRPQPMSPPPIQPYQNFQMFTGAATY